MAIPADKIDITAQNIWETIELAEQMQNDYWRPSWGKCDLWEQQEVKDAIAAYNSGATVTDEISLHAWWVSRRSADDTGGTQNDKGWVYGPERVYSVETDPKVKEHPSVRDYRGLSRKTKKFWRMFYEQMRNADRAFAA